jgi:uncharacterized protein (DUF1778 family)
MTERRARKDERVALRLPADVKRTLQQAADATGRSLTDFVVDSAVRAARKAIAERERMRLAERDRVVFLKALSRPAKPNRALKSAAARYRERVE